MSKQQLLSEVYAAAVASEVRAVVARAEALHAANKLDWYAYSAIRQEAMECVYFSVEGSAPVTNHNSLQNDAGV